MTKFTDETPEGGDDVAARADRRTAPTSSMRKAAADEPQRKGGRGHRGPSAARGEIRERIKTEAREEFIEKGYDGATVRAIARRAGCDSGLVSYYFESKQKLFRACMDLPLDPAAEAIRLLAAGPEGAARRLVEYGVSVYEESLTADTLFALMRALMTDAATSRRFRTYIRTDVLDRVGEYIGAGEEFGEQIALTLGTMYGIISMRYIVKLEPIASMPRERFIDLLEPILQERIDRFTDRMAWSERAD
ncbi:TetR/AcrR family transcriptional regulator [Actinomyces culturomici]|uniref:TetR/AcrR family transcriptional regulator n=1 Tax=Actinomyces culturomici TaxID=1926276 RepID=UPI001F315B1D|nr:TetR family transcriptional regulator [Actinomyces culturomici]